MRVISLFSGCGGLDWGFIKAGFEVVWANDFDKEAVQSYKFNIGEHIVHDSIYNIKTDEIPDADILIGGFPCLGFTVAKGKDRKLDCDYNQLFQEYARVLEAKQPKYFLDWDKPSPTITGRGSRTGGAVIHPHPNRHRRLTVRECARIQSFSDDFIFSGSNGACFAQIGNAVPPIMSFFIANEFRILFGKEKLPFEDTVWNLPYVEKIRKLLIKQEGEKIKE
jgi:site-specific DNA-cytosine methylase